MYIRSFTMLQSTTSITLWRIRIKTLVRKVPFILHNQHRSFTSTFWFCIFALIYLFYVPIRQNEFIFGSLYSAKHSFNTWEEARHWHMCMWIVYFFDKSQGLIVPYGWFWSVWRNFPNQRSTWAQLVYNQGRLLFYRGLFSFGLPRLRFSFWSFHRFINSCLNLLSRFLRFLKRADTIRISLLSARFWPKQFPRFYFRLCLRFLFFRSFFEFLNCFCYCMWWNEF